MRDNIVNNVLALIYVKPASLDIISPWINTLVLLLILINLVVALNAPQLHALAILLLWIKLQFAQDVFQVYKVIIGTQKIHNAHNARLIV